MANGRLLGASAADFGAVRRALGRAPLWLPVVIAPLLAGTAERPYTLVLAALGALAVLWAALRVWRRGEVLRVSFFALAVLVLATASLLQCIPLPLGLRALLAPGSEATLRQLLAGLGGEVPRFRPLSVDPGATANEVARLLGYLSLLLALGTLLQRRGDSQRLGRVIYGSASLVAALGGLAALGVPLPTLWAIPSDGATRALLPAAFYNSNHLAALLLVGAIVTVGAMLQTASWAERGLLAGLLALQNLALLGTLSRAGIVCGLGGELVVLWHAERQARPPARWRTLVLLGGPLLAAALAVLANPTWLGLLRQRFAVLSAAGLLAEGSKTRAWLDALPLLRGHLALGVGRGAFEAAFASHHRLAGATRFVYLENEWLQVLVDWGVPLGLGLLALLGLGLRDAAGWGAARAPKPGGHSQVRRAALVAFVALLGQNTVDFSLEVGGVAVAGLALVALLERPRFTLRPLWGVGLAAVTLVSTAGAYWLCPSHEEDGARLRALAENPAHSPTEVVALGTQLARRHPLDSYLYSTVAARLWHAQQPAAMAFVNLALAANSHDLLARRTSTLILAQYGHREQALRTLALALPDGNRPQRRWLYATALAVARTPAELLLGLPAAADWLPAELPPGLVADELLELLGESAATPPWPVVRAVATWGRERGAQSALLWLGRAALVQRDAPAALDLLGALYRAGAPPLLIGDLLALAVETGHLAAAEQLSQTVLRDCRAAEVLLAQALLQERRGELVAARALLDTALTTAERPALRARVHEVRAELETRAGNLHRAQLERAAALQPGP